MLDLCRIKEDFSVLVKEAQPWTLTQFVMWLDLKLSEFKIKGYMVLDHHTKTKPKWIAEEDTTSDVAPIPPTCRQCHKPTNDGNFYSDLHASPSSHRTVVQRPQQPMEDSESVRGEVGIIDLSHAVNVRRDSRPQESEIRAKNYQTLFREKSSNVQIERDKGRKDDVIEIDGSSPTEKMFITSANKTSTPVTTNTRPVVKKQKIRPSLSMGTAIYTSTTSVTTPTFSSSYMSSPSRNTMPSLSNRKYALGAPPVSVPSNLDEMIAQAVQFNEIRTDQSLQSQSHSVQANRTDQSLQSQSPLVQANITDIRSIQQQPKLQELVQTSFTVKSPVQTSFTVKSPVQTSFTEQHIVQSNINEPTVSLFPQTSTSSSAVPVALHANIDNISRDISQNSAHSSSDTMEIKIESEVDNSLGDSFFVGSFDDPGSPEMGDGLHSDKEDSTYNPAMLQQHASYRKDIELPVFDDPMVRRALEDNKPPSRHLWSKIITRCAYHLLSKGVPRKHDYQMFAESFYRRYPCVGTARGPNPWSGLAHSISASIRNLRWNARKKVKAQQYQNFSLT